MNKVLNVFALYAIYIDLSRTTLKLYCTTHIISKSVQYTGPIAINNPRYM